MDKLQLLKLAESQDTEAFYEQDLEPLNTNEREEYERFYDDVKQPRKYIKEDW